MTGARITVDGLWRCLCPSFDAATLTRAFAVPYRPRPWSSRVSKTACANSGIRRHLHATSPRFQPVDNKRDTESHSVDSRGESETDTHQHNEDAPEPSEPDRKGLTTEVDQGATEAWRGYFDVVFPAQMKPHNRKDQADSSPKDDVLSAEEEDQTDPGRIDSKQLAHKQMFAAEDTNSLIDPLDHNFGSDRTAESQISKARETEGSSLLALDDAEAQRDPFAVFANAVGDPHASNKKQAVASVGQAPPRQPRLKRHDFQEAMVTRLTNLEPPYEHVPEEASAGDLFEAIRKIRTRAPKKFRLMTAALLKRLLSMPGVKPSVFVYDTLFRAHSLTEGSVDVVTGLLKEMRQNEIRWSSAHYHSVLRLLAVHPDYLLRNDMIREMRERWIEILPKGHRYIAVGLLRDEQYELALEHLDRMVEHGIEVDPWVFDIFTYVFGKLEFLEDALRITRFRVDRGLPVPVNVWYYMLDVCSKAQNHVATTYVWNRTVHQGIVTPSDGVALNILNMAAVYGDTDLATEVIQYLAERGTRLARPHYEALADAYSMQGNVERAIEVFCIMYGAGAEVGQTSVGTLCQVMGRDPHLIDKAIEAMTSLKTQYNVPISVYNAVLNETLKSSALPAHEAYARGLDLYQRVREFVSTGPNWETFRNLLARCTKPDIAQFLVGEMVAFNIRQNLVLAELALKVHVDYDGPLHRAKNNFYKVAPHLRTSYPRGSRRWQNIMDLAVRLVKRLIAEGDPEAWRILDICKHYGLDEQRILALKGEVEAGELTMAGDPSPASDTPRLTKEEWAQT